MARTNPNSGNVEMWKCGNVYISVSPVMDFVSREMPYNRTNIEECCFTRKVSGLAYQIIVEIKTKWICES